MQVGINQPFVPDVDDVDAEISHFSSLHLQAQQHLYEQQYFHYYTPPPHYSPFTPCMTPSLVPTLIPNYMCSPSPFVDAKEEENNPIVQVDYQQLYQFIQQQTQMYLTFIASQQGVVYQHNVTPIQYVNCSSGSVAKSPVAKSPVAKEKKLKIKTKMPNQDFETFITKTQAEINKINDAKVIANE